MSIASFETRRLIWLTGDDTGISSETIVAYLALGYLPSGRRGSHPHDPDDLGRCVRMLERLPELRPRLGEMSALSPAWAALVAHWDELEALYREEEPSRRAPKCYARMRELIEAAGAKW